MKNIFSSLIGTILLTIIITSGVNAQKRNSCLAGTAKYVPLDGKKLLIIGQDVTSVGGLSNYSNGYVDDFGYVPSGITTYTSLPSLAGTKYVTNYGAGDIHADLYNKDRVFDSTSMVIGLYLVDQEKSIADGKQDSQIKQFAEWVKGMNRPVYLRIGYEFDGDHNHYNAALFIKMWQRIVDVFDENQVVNCDFVWQSDGVHSIASMNKYYPGDDYVDWFGFSYFSTAAGEQLIRMAKTHNKPVMVAEATPRGRDTENENGEAIWNSFFQPLFDLINKYDHVKALAYINADWDAQRMWKNEKWGDTRIQVNADIKSRWDNEIETNQWLKGDGNFFGEVGYPIEAIDDDCFVKEVPLTIERKSNDLHFSFIANPSSLVLNIQKEKVGKLEKVQVVEVATGRLIEEWDRPIWATIEVQLTPGLYLIRSVSIKGTIKNSKILICDCLHK